MFLPREEKILNLLLKNEKKLTTSQIAAELGVSLRTIKTDIKKVNEVLSQHFCCIQTQQGVGVWLDCDKVGKHKLELLLYEDRDLYILADVRKYYVAVDLLLCNGYTSMETIANKLYVSRGTVVTDINELDAFWKKFGLVFIKKVKYGIKVEGTEKQIRLALTDALKKIAGIKGRISIDKVQKIFQTVNFDALKTIILNTGKRFQFALSDVSFDEFMVQLAVIIVRLENNCIMEPTGHELLEKDITNDVGHRVRFIVQFLREQLFEKLQLELPDSELPYLLTCLYGLRFQVPMIKQKDKGEIRLRSPEMFDYMMSVIREMDEKYRLNLEEDDEIICAMFDHLECMIHRIKSKMFLANPMLESVKKEMFYEYEIASYLVSKLGVKYEIEASEDEIGYITFYIGTAMERTKEKREKSLSVTIVCMTGSGTSQFIATKLKRNFADLKIEKIISVNQAKKLTGEEQNFVISTVPLHLDGIPVIEVSSALSNVDMQRVQRYIQTRENSREEVDIKYPYLQQLLHNSISIMSCDMKSKEEVIELLGGRMFRNRYVDEGYVSAVLKREGVSETAIGNMIAIPHAFEGHIQKKGIGLLTLQKPIAWGKEKVQIVLMLALDAKGENDFQGIFEDILNLRKNAKDVAQLLKVKKYSDLKIWKNDRREADYEYCRDD